MRLILLIAVLLILLSVVLYHKTIRPMRIIQRGMDLVREQDFASRLRRVGQRDADRLVDMFNEMMECLKQERLRVREQNEFLDLLINESTSALVLPDDSGRLEAANRAAKEILASAPQIAETINQMKMQETRTLKLTDRNEIYRLTRLGFMDRGWMRPFVIIERLTDEIREAERQAYARVIRMMAHEVNNSMGGISSALQSIESELAGRPEAERFMSPLQACSERADSLTGFIKAYAEVVKIPEPQLRLTDYCELVESSLPLLESICGHTGARLTANLEEAVPLRLDPVQMQQVIFNIVKNAAENAGAGGFVNIEAEGKTLTVSNSGPAIPQEVAERIFSDVVSTKPAGQGLGLMLVAEILRKHRARFSLTSAAADLTVFRITLP